MTASPVSTTPSADRPPERPGGLTSASSAAHAAPRRIWIDLDNTPHVPFFLPIIRALEKEGHHLLVTARDAFQVKGLAAYHGLECVMVGRHYGASRALKVTGTLWRAAQLLPVVLRGRPDIAMSHGSRSLEIVAAALRIPSMLLFDYEHASRLPFVRPAMGMAPVSLANPSLGDGFKHGLRTYDGLKEDVYAAGFRPDSGLLERLGIAPDEVLVTVRPPATEAHYHNPEAEALYVEVVNLLCRDPRVRMVILPRTAGAQRSFVKETWPEWCAARKIIVPEEAIDGLNLVWLSDLVVSGGGTMNREAAALGVPVYSIFRGKLGGVDKYLADTGRLVLIESIADVRRCIVPAKRQGRHDSSSAERQALGQILEATRELMTLADAR
jgi:predicted glycosyltransferase